MLVVGHVGSVVILGIRPAARISLWKVFAKLASECGNERMEDIMEEKRQSTKESGQDMREC